MDLFRSICVFLTGLLFFQVVSPGAAFCLKENSRVIQCRSLWLSPPPSVVSEVAETSCCNNTCKEKLPEGAKTQNQPPADENEKSCCISLHVEHEGVICMFHSDLDVPACGAAFDSIKPFVDTSGFLPNSVIEKSPSLACIQSVVLIL